MASVAAQNLTMQFGNQVVLENVSFELHAGETAGLVGANGAGKTTLLRLVAGEIQPDKGTITRTRGLEIGFLKQEPDVGLDGTLRDEVGAAFADLLALEERLHNTAERIAACTDSGALSALMETYERINAQFISAGGLRLETKLNEVLGGLGFMPADYTRPMSTLSGGQKCRAALAKLLLGDQHFLLLDEPTNHLDVDAVRWLEKFLVGHRGGAVIISHDRYLLDRLCDRIIEIDRAKTASFPGNYSNYSKTKEIRLLTQQRQFQKDAEFIKKEQTFIAKHIAAQRTKQARGRRKRLERRLKGGEFVTEKPRARRVAGFAFQKTRTEASAVLRCDQLGMRYDEHVLFTDLTFQVPAGARFGITGPNGTGKTTLLKIILGEVLPTGGSYTFDPKLNVGYYAQEHTCFDPHRPIVEEIRCACPELTEQDARSLLGRYLFSGDDVFKPLGLLSGGEQSRVRLAKLMLQMPDVLILDEPTNHLDIPSLEVLEEALLEFPGMIVVVSHDRYLLDRIVDRLLVIRREGHAIYDGNYSFYVEQVELQRTADKGQQPTARKKRKRDTAADRKAGTGPSPYDRLSVEEIEALIVEYEARLAALNQRFGDPAVYKDRDALIELRRELNAVAEELADVDAVWQERVDTQ